MPYTYIPQTTYLAINPDGNIEFIHEGEVIMTMTPEEARSNAADLIEAAGQAEFGKRP